MLRCAALVSAAALFLAACGGGGDDGGGAKTGVAGSSDATGGGSRAMAAAMEAQFTRLKDCFQGEKDGKGECKEDLFNNKVTELCSAVHTGRSNEFAVSDFKPFEPVCSSWSALLATPLAQKPDTLAGMIDKVKAIN